MKALLYQPGTLRWIGCKLLSTVSPRVYWSPLSGLRLRDTPVPELPGDGWVRLRTIMGGICGTDLSIILQRNHPASFLPDLASFPMVLGHENLAVIDGLGSGVSGWRLGERVCVEPALSCEARGREPLCPACRQGHLALCEASARDGRLPKGLMIGLNAFTGGSWAPYFVAHHTQLHRVPDAIPDRQAILTDAMACALHGVLRHRPGEADRVGVVGGGVLGLGVVAGLRALGCKAHVTALARHPFQADWLRRLGASEVLRVGRKDPSQRRYDLLAERLDGQRLQGRFGNHGFLGGFDVVYDCVGTGRSITDSLKFTRARGTTVLLGTSGITIMDSTPVWSKELRVLGGYGRQVEEHDGRRLHTYELLFELVQAGRLPLDGLLTHTFALGDYKRALASLTARRREPVIKAAFRFE